MDILLQRCQHKSTGTLSMLLVDGEVYGFVPEDPPQEVKIKGQTRIPAGRYRLYLATSPKFSEKYRHKMIYLENVQKPDGSFRFDGVMFHPGNTAEQTEGCIMPNMQCILGEVPVYGHSTVAYEKFQKEVGEFLEQGGEAHVTVRDEEFLWQGFGNTHSEPVTVS